MPNALFIVGRIVSLCGLYMLFFRSQQDTGGGGELELPQGGGSGGNHTQVETVIILGGNRHCRDHHRGLHVP